MLLCAVLLGACAGKEDANIASKIEGGETLTKNDYTVLVDYCVKYATDAQKYQDIINAAPSADSQEAIDATNEIEALGTKYQYADMFFKCLDKSTPEQIGKENVQKVNDNASLDYFMAPSWATIKTSDNVEGFIEETPSVAATDSTGVISEGDGEVVK